MQLDEATHFSELSLEEQKQLLERLEKSLQATIIVALKLKEDALRDRLRLREVLTVGVAGGAGVAGPATAA